MSQDNDNEGPKGRMVDERPLDKIPKAELIAMVEVLRSRRSTARERRVPRSEGTKTPRAKKPRVNENAELEALLEGEDFLNA